MMYDKLYKKRRKPSLRTNAVSVAIQFLKPSPFGLTPPRGGGIEREIAQ